MTTQEAASIVANRMYAFGETYAVAKAWAVANLAAVGSELDNVQANITTLGGQALAARSIGWYHRTTLFADMPASSPAFATVPGLNLQGQEGNVLQVTNGAFALGATAAGGLTGVTTFGSTPNANGLSVSGANVLMQPADATHPGGLTAAKYVQFNSAMTSVGAVGAVDANGATFAANALSLSPADATHPGVVTTGTQTFAGAKTFNAAVVGLGSAVLTTTASFQLCGSLAGGNPAIALGQAGSNSLILWTDLDATVVAAPGATGSVYLRTNGGAGTTMALVNPTNLDLTGMGTGGSIKLKDTSGVTRTCTIDGTTGLWVIV